MAKAKITEITRELIKDFLAENRLELYHLDFSKEGKDWYLSLYIDKLNEDGSYGYCDTDTCEKVSRYLSERLDEADPIEQNYFLVVSSPGLDRELFKDEDYERFKGHKVDVSLYKPFEGSKSYTGDLLEKSDKSLKIAAETVEKKGKSVSIRELELPCELVSKVKLAVLL